MSDSCIDIARGRDVPLDRARRDERPYPAMAAMRGSADAVEEPAAFAGTRILTWLGR